MNLIFIATAWGTLSGGINVFNRDLASACARLIGPSGQVYCVAPNPTVEAKASAKNDGVEIIPVSQMSFGNYDDSIINEIENWLRSHRKGTEQIHWIGHDVITGPIAVAASRRVGGTCTLIHHMSYISYKGFEKSNAIEADYLSREQRRVFSSGANLLGVGPLLTRSCKELSERAVTELIPGFPDFPKENKHFNSAFTAITFGRMDRAHGRIKQGRLAVCAFGEAIRSASEGVPKIKNLINPRPRIFILGLDQDSNDERNELSRLAEEAAGRVVTTFPLPYNTDRSEVLRRTQSADVAMMLSWHEGFGLAGWEALAAGVPLILSQHSGLYELVERDVSDPGLSCFRAIDIEGQTPSNGKEAFTEKDLNSVSRAIMEICTDHSRWLSNARKLRELLQKACVCSWRNAARTLIESMGITKVGVVNFGSPSTSACVACDGPRKEAQENIDLAISDLDIKNWLSLTSRSRMQLVSLIEHHGAGELSFKEIKKFCCNDSSLPIPIFIHIPSGIELHLVLGGSYEMGDSDWQKEYNWCASAYSDWQEQWSIRTTPVHKRHISPFLCSRFPVLQEQWDLFKHDCGLRDKRSLQSPRSPIDGVSWYDLQSYLIAARLRLPSEAEWEWACSVGSSTRFFWGDKMNPRYCWYVDNSSGGIHIVDEHLDLHNQFGLVDMLGNIWEWCSDDWVADYKSHHTDSQPFRTSAPARHASMRGGGWNNWPPTCRTRFRSHWAKEDRLNNSGFRVAREIFKKYD